MAVVKLITKRVEKPWGRRTLWPAFDDVMNCGEPVGEIWFQMPDGSEPDLLVKYLFTSENLSIQVHPDDEGAKTRGYPRGKDEAWVVLEADPGATIAIGTRRVMTREELREAALNGTIEDVMFWKSVKAGDVFYSPAGTVHAIGEGLTLVEIQQNVDLTYRLWDYGRPRELHLDDGIAVSDPVPYVTPHVPREIGDGRTILCDGPKFVLERWKMEGAGELQPQSGKPVWVVPLVGGGSLAGQPIKAGEAWVVDEKAEISLKRVSDVLVAYPGEDVFPGVWTRR